MKRIRHVPVLAALVLATLALGACGEKHDTVAGSTTSGSTPTLLRLMLDYIINADHVGIFQSVVDGDMAKTGLDVHIQVAPDPAAPLKLLEAGKTDIAISYEPELLLARDKGAQLVAVGAIVQRPLTSLMTLDPKLRTVADLRGKSVGTAGIPYQSAYLQTILARAGVPQDSVKEINVGFNLVPAMLSKKLDATLGAFWNIEGVQLQRAGKHPHIIHMEQVGVPNYDELVLVARKDTLAQRGDDIRAFVQAVGRGYAKARENPVGAADALVKSDPGLDRAFALATIQASLPAFFPADKSKPFGWQDPAQWDAYGQWMYDHHLLSTRPAPGVAFTNEFLAGQGS